MGSFPCSGVVLCLAAWWLVGILRPVLVAAAPSSACPAVEANSLSPCDRCVSSDMCPTPRNGTTYICDPFTKLCVGNNWSSAEVEGRCGGNDPFRPGNWHAMCKLACLSEGPPYACALSQCLNEDFPCNWVPGCNPPFGLSWNSIHCLRSCADHESMLSTNYGLNTCEAAIQRHGCYNSWHRIADFCPHSCTNSQECGSRCGRDEVANANGRQCWQLTAAAPPGELTQQCISHMRLGSDCHCKCGNLYVALRGSGARGSGAFTTRDSFNGLPVFLEVNVTAGQPFFLDLTGEGMTDEDVGMLSGPRVKVVPSGSDCGISELIPDLTGLICQRPPGGLTLQLACTSPPSVATKFLHRWPDVVIRRCGTFDICHCNRDCGGGTFWKLAGHVHVEPTLDFSDGVHKAYPGCGSFFPTARPSLQVTQNESRQDEILRVALAITGGLASEEANVQAVQNALAGFLSSFSVLLDQELPQATDITLEQARRLGVFMEGRGRRLQGADVACRDDDAAFAMASGQVGMPFVSCITGLGFFQDSDLLCNDAQLGEAARMSCPETCALCTQAPTPAPPTPAPTPGTTTEEPEPLFWPDTPSSLRLHVEVVSRTNWQAEYMVARIAQLREVEMVQATFVHLLFQHLPAVPPADTVVPEKLMVQVVGPTSRSEVIPVQGPGQEKKWETSSAVWIIVGCSTAGSVLLALLCVGIWSYFGPEEAEEEIQPGKEVISVSDGGYRVKSTWVEGEKKQAPVPKKRKPMRCGCVRRCLSRCYRRCCAKKLRRVAPSSRSVAGDIEVGSIVKLTGLSQVEYNGLKGTVLDGPNDKGRFTVDVVIVDDEDNPEHLILSFRQENLKLWSPAAKTQLRGAAMATNDAVGAIPSQPARAPVPGSYRAQQSGFGPGSYRG